MALESVHPTSTAAPQACGYSLGHRGPAAHNGFFLRIIFNPLKPVRSAHREASQSHMSQQPALFPAQFFPSNLPPSGEESLAVPPPAQAVPDASAPTAGGTAGQRESHLTPTRSFVFLNANRKYKWKGFPATAPPCETWKLFLCFKLIAAALLGSKPG